MNQADQDSERDRDEPEDPPSLLPEDEESAGDEEEPSFLPDEDEKAGDEPSLLPEDEEGQEGSFLTEEEAEAQIEEAQAEEAEPEEAPEIDTHIYAIKTTINQESSVSQIIGNKAKKHDVPVMAILHPTELRGYLLVEATDRMRLEDLVRGIPHMRGMVEGETDLDEVRHFLTPKPSVEGIAEGDIVELISGPFKGERARVQRIDESKEEITVELFEAMVPIPVTVSGDAVRVLEKDEG